MGLGHAQETLLRVEEAIRTGKLPEVPVYLDGMLWDITAIHTAYPDFLSSAVRNQIFQDNNPFTAGCFTKVGSPTERKEVIEGGPCIIIATSGMLVGGASVEYFKQLADNPKNIIIFEGPPRPLFLCPGGPKKNAEKGGPKAPQKGLDFRPEIAQTCTLSFPHPQTGPKELWRASRDGF